MPENYEKCGTCGHDHSYDYDYLSPEDKDRAIEAHLEAGDIVINED